MERRERKKDLSTNMNHEAAMDSFLDLLGLYRKPIAKDGSCLFRAVAEQIFNCQAEHTRVRKECIEYMKKNEDRFEAFVEGPFDHHLFNLRSQKEWAGQVEIQALSMMYKCDFLVYKDINSVPIKATENDYEKKIILCYSNGNHYDSIYPHSHKNNLGVCQSIVFELLYGQVFPLLMMKDPENKATSPTDQNDKQNDFGESTLVNGYGSENGNENDGWTTVKSKKQGKMSTKNQKNVDQFYSEQVPLSPASTKLNWEVMRSIDPDGYRNIELEVWEENRKEQQQKDHAVAATFQFKKGDRCQVKHPFDEKFYLAIIDDVFDEKCKIWIPELKERKVMPFSRLKPKEQNSNSGYRELSGYYRKQENSQDNNSPRGGDDQKGGRRRKSNRNRKGNVGDANERSQQEMPIQEDPSSRQRGDKNRRRRNNSNTARTREDKKEFTQREYGNGGQQNQGSVEVSAFPALPKRDEQTEKAKDDSDSNPDPATFWRKRREVEQMEKTTADSKENTVMDPVPVEDSLVSEEIENDVKDDILENQVESFENEWPETVPEKMPEELAQDIPQETPQKIPDEIRQELPQELPHEIPQELPQEKPQEIPRDESEEIAEVKPVTTEKRVNWQDLNNDIRNNYENIDVNNDLQTNEQTTEPTYMNNRPPLKETVIEIEDGESIPEDEGQSYNSMDQVLFDRQRNFGILKNPARQEVQVEPSTTRTFSRYVQAESAVLENGTTVEQVIKERKESPVLQMTNNQTIRGNETPPLVNQNDNKQERDVSPTVTPDHVNHHPINAATIQNEILSGNITYSSDPEGKDLPKDMEIVRHLFNYGIYMYQYFNGMNSVFPGSAPISAMYPVMNPNAMYAMQQSYQNRPMMMPQNMYPQMQQPAHDESQQQSPGEETRENNDSPAYKPSISLHQSPSYHTSHAMAAAQQQAMFNMNYGQMFATAGRPLYSSYNMFPPQRSAFPRYLPNKMGFNRQTRGKYNNSRYTRNDNQPNVKLHNLQTGYGPYSKEAE
ncbi:Hypothetical predicted protein [Paramuricea clavata]|uniref:Uncharacterized protein n=1 Tax=Paramuricea clavata TaxID=317549 RepID=A0A7D9HAC4_PARCT|nr:Hypothetical predicted protein [Paramuricea clavata]